MGAGYGELGPALSNLRGSRGKPPLRGTRKRPTGGLLRSAKRARRAFTRAVVARHAQGPKVRRLFVGGNRIRTLSPANLDLDHRRTRTAQFTAKHRGSGGLEKCRPLRGTDGSSPSPSSEEAGFHDCLEKLGALWLFARLLLFAVVYGAAVQRAPQWVSGLCSKRYPPAATAIE